MRIDFHCHTMVSKDAFGTLEEISSWAMVKGIDAVVITDHEVQSLTSVKLVDSVSFIPGIELYTKYGHVLGAGLKKTIDHGTRKTDPIESIHEAGGFAIIAHPFEIGFKAKRVETIIGIDAVEVMNASSFSFNWTYQKASRFARRMNLPQTAGSDSHIPRTVGNACLEVDATDADEALSLAMKGKGTPKGHPTSAKDRLKLELLRVLRRKVFSSSGGSKVIRPD